MNANLSAAAPGRPAALPLAFSHLGLFVRDIDAVANFYKTVLRFTETDRGNLGHARLIFLSRDPSEHHQIVLVSGRPEELRFNVVNQISFRVPDLATLRRFHELLVAAGVDDIQPVTHGNAVSIYCRDPEGNRLEIFMDTDWYCEQPLREPVDFRDSDEEIMRKAEAIARRYPRFQPRAEWQARIAKLMEADQNG
ncbi:glyoxalase [Pigmentiphaga sp. NML080357]|uniref:VOC family protein n=1 Tax=Pigmentiphaga sp. NML080357 TaxID=2008675 RepID=UPI000B41AC04|nr:VOC family protein [Pigmentiphaga sp. NML080357]OVZ56884.1 glyoxalase [Pigmentiphaga sp. NML080357]